VRRWAAVPLVGVGLVLVVVLGPRERFEERWAEPDLPADLDAYLRSAEAAVPALRPGDGKEVVWADPATRRRTPLAIAYLHGFSADRHEVEPLVSGVAADLGANLLFTRLRGHGRDGAAMAEATVEAWLDDTAEAVAIGGRIGERVVLVGTSTGGTLALWAATREEVRDRLAAVVLISPNFHPADRSSRLLLYPWGGLIARGVVGDQRCFTAENARQEAHWTTCYPTEALLPMMALVEHVRTMELSGVKTPALLVYSPSDRVVDVAETERVAARLTEAPLQVVRFETSDDPGQHVLAGDILSPASTPALASLIREFLARSAPGSAGRAEASAGSRSGGAGP
jgi:esterase/lipase